MKGKAVCAVLLLTMGMAHAQDTRPVQPERESDEAGLWMQVDRVERDLKSSSALVRDPALTGYVQTVACAVAGAMCPMLRVHVIAAPGFAISSLPNGAIFLSTGLLLRTGDEAQLAHLLGHEIGHYRNRDTLRQFNRMLNTSGVVALLGVAAAGFGVNFVGTAASTAALNMEYAHSRDEERRADASGFESAIAAGYDPRAAAIIWKAIAAEQEVATRKGADAFLAQHPMPDDRQTRLQTLEDAAPKRAFWKNGAQAWRTRMTPWQQGWIDEELRRDDSGQGIALFTRLVTQEPGRGLYRYALGETYRKRGAPGDDARAQSCFRDAIALPDAPPLAWRGLGLVAMQGGDARGAREAFARYRASAPDADDKAMIDHYLAQL